MLQGCDCSPTRTDDCIVGLSWLPAARTPQAMPRLCVGRPERMIQHPDLIKDSKRLLFCRCCAMMQCASETVINQLARLRGEQPSNGYRSVCLVCKYVSLHSASTYSTAIAGKCHAVPNGTVVGLAQMHTCTPTHDETACFCAAARRNAACR